MRIYRYHLLCLLSLLALSGLAGCSGDDPEQFWSDYHQRLSAQLDLPEIERRDPPNIGELPARDSLTLAVPEVRASLLNVYALRQCGIASLIADRNNALGLIAAPSQQWLYERALWQRLSGCWETDVPDQLNDDNYARLRSLTLEKSDVMPDISWNAVVESSEWRDSFARASQPVMAIDDDVLEEQLAALEYLYQMTLHQFDRDWKQDSGRLEGHLQVLQQRPLTAEFLRTLMLGTQRLDEATRVMLKADNSRCLDPWPTESMSRLARQSRKWLTALNRLMQIHPVEPPQAWQAYRQRWLDPDASNTPLSAFQAALDQHRERRRLHPACSAG